MLVLAILLITFVLSTGVLQLSTGDWHFILSGNIAMCLMLCFTAMGHFKFPDGMEKMLPRIIPMKKEVVFLTGILEIIAGLSLLFPEFRSTAGVLLIVFFILILPANVHAAMHNLNYQKGTLDGPGISYLWFRIPMQLLLIFWVWFFAVKN